MSFDAFSRSSHGALIAPLLDSTQIVARMKALSLAGAPAVGALDEALAGTIELDHTERQHVGRWVREVLAAHGLRPVRQRRLSGGRVFSSGMIYQPIGRREPVAEVPTTLLPCAQRIERARALAAMDESAYGVIVYLDDKRAEAAAETAR